MSSSVRPARSAKNLAKLLAAVLAVVSSVLVAMAAIVIDSTGSRSAKVRKVVVSGLRLPHDPGFVGPSYYANWSDGPSSSMSYFPIQTYQTNIGQSGPGEIQRIKAAGINGVDMAYDGGGQGNLSLAAASGLTENVAAPLSAFSSGFSSIVSYAMQDAPDYSGPYQASQCSPSNSTDTAPTDPCAQGYVNAANAYRAGDPTRPVWGNFSKDTDPWEYPPSGWSTTQMEGHVRAMTNADNIVSADGYGWSDPYEWNMNNGVGTGHYGAWIDGARIDRLRYFNPHAPGYILVECCDSGDGNGSSKPANTMMPGMIKSSVWDAITHGARGVVYWTTDFWDSSPGGDPYDKPYSGASYYGDSAVWNDQQWSPQYAAIQQIDGQIQTNVQAINSPTVTGISATSSDGTPIATLGKDNGGKLWLTAMADGNTSEPLSNTSPITATITLPSTIPAGTILTVTGENRTITVNANHQITDTFGTTTETPTYTSTGHAITYGYQHHIYTMP